jgi:hypothetical protein
MIRIRRWPQAWGGDLRGRRGVADDSRGANTLGEVKELLVTYARQQTVDPLRNLGRYLAFGIVGSVFISLSAIYLTVGILRLLQTETGSTFTGNLSWIPYLLTLLVDAVGLALTALAIKRVRNAQAQRLPRSNER